jgi:EmrB/QacA subfamily drug resistance transporter
MLRAMGDGAVDNQEYPYRLDARLLRIGAVCLLISVMASLDATIVAVAQRTFVVEFDSTQAVVGWTTAGYILGLVTVTPMTGWAADRFGTKRLFMGSVLVFTLASLLCAVAPTLQLLIAFRLIQGMGGGFLMPLTLTIMTREAGPNRLGRLMAMAAVPMMLAPIGGPALGGWLIRAYGWEWLFLINLPAGLAAFALAAILFPRDQSTPSETFDFIGMILLSPGVATFLYGLSEIPGRGTVADRHVWIPMIIGIGLITAFVLHALYRTGHPLIDLGLLTNRDVGLANVGVFIYVVAGCVGLLLPSCFQQLMHQTPAGAGLHMIPAGLGVVVTMPLAGVLMDRFGPGRVALAGLTLVVIGMGAFTYGVAAHLDYAPTLLVAMVITGMGSGCTLLPISASAVRTLARNRVARGATLITVTEMMASSVGFALMSVLLTYQLDRSENISAANTLAVLQQEAAESGLPVDPAAIPPATLAPDFTSSLQHDLSHAYAVVFLVATALAALTFIPAAFLPRRPATPLAAEASATPPD